MVRTRAPAPDPGVAKVARALLARRTGDGAFIVAITGAVAVGKTTFATTLERVLKSTGSLSVERVCTDGFLYSNAMLAERDLAMRKGFPESYDTAALIGALTTVRAGGAEFPGYSHVTYDVDPALVRRISAPDILLVEGLSLPIASAAAGTIDALIYLDADEAVVEAWYVARFLELWTAAQFDPGSFYARFRHLGREEAQAFARSVWRAINLPNLRENIAPARDIADIVVTKGADHRTLGVLERRGGAQSCI
ncbi:MAG TPA: hypothetical protein VII73_08495 [Caulobacteraceae bacterium]